MPDPTDKKDRPTHNQKIKVTAILVRLGAEGKLADLTLTKATTAVSAEAGFPVHARLVGSICRTLGLELKKPAPGKSAGKSRWHWKRLRDDLDAATAKIETLERRLASLESSLGVSPGVSR